MKICKIDGCNRKHYALGFCKAHWRRQREHGDPGSTDIRPHRSGRYCSVASCNEVHKAKHYCHAHYMQFQVGGPQNLRKPLKKERHGLCKTPEYGVWAGMKGRCRDKNHNQYYDYGGRGIRVCERWQKSFFAFYTDMGPRPTPKHQLDRKDNDKGYTPDNCRWATRREQNFNKRNTVMTLERIEDLACHVAAGGSIRKWSKTHGISHITAGNAFRAKLLEDFLAAATPARIKHLGLVS